MRLSVTSAISMVRRLHPTLARLAGIFAGIYLMGAHDFFIFYFVHMILKSLMALFLFDSDVSVFRNLRKYSKIETVHFAFLVLISALSSIVILLFYLCFIFFFEKIIAPGVIDVEFFKIYSLTIISCVAIPFSGVIRANSGYWVKALVLRGRNLMNLSLIIVFAIVGIDGSFVPYIWLSTGVMLSIFMIILAIYHLYHIEKSDQRIFNSLKARTVFENTLAYSARRTNNRATFLATKGVMSAFLGPFAGLALKSINFGDQTKRQGYVNKIRNRQLVNQLDGSIPDAVKRSFAKDRPFRIGLMIASVLLAGVVALRGTLDAFLLLGLLVVVSKILSISLRVLVLNRLASRKLV